MTLRTFQLPERNLRALHELPEFENLLVSSWNLIAINLQNLLSFARLKFEAASDPTNRAYLGRELIAITTEVAELVASQFLRFRHGGSRKFHQASNEELDALFTELAASTSSAEVLKFLGVVLVPEIPPSVAERIASQAANVMADLAGFWRQNIDEVRWFRHFPSSLTMHEPQLIDRSQNESLSEVVRRIQSTDDLLDVSVHPDGRSFEYVGLRLTTAAIAPGLCRTALQMVFNRAANQLLDLSSSDPEYSKPKLYPFLLHFLSDEEKSDLEATNAYFIVRPG